MSENKFLKCTCAQCGGHIEFPADGIGSIVPCPHCGWQTELTLAAPEETSAGSQRSLKWVIAGVIILVIGVVAAITAVAMARRLVEKQRVRKTDLPVPAPAAKQTAAIVNGFSTSEVKIQKTPGSTLVYAVGTVKNETDKQRFSVGVEVDLFDSAGRKVGTARDYKDTVEPRGEWTFRALLVQKAVVTARVATVREQP